MVRSIITKAESRHLEVRLKDLSWLDGLGPLDLLRSEPRQCGLDSKAKIFLSFSTQEIVGFRVESRAIASKPPTDIWEILPHVNLTERTK